MRTKIEIIGDMNYVDFLVRCKLDFKFFCEQMLGITDYGGIHPYQLNWFHLIQNNDRVLIRAPSGFSKTTITGVAYPLWVIWNYTNKKILLVSKTIAQSKDALLMQIRYYIEDNEILRTLIPKDKDKTWSQTQLVTSNKNSIINRPYSENIKGYRGDIIVLDEAASYDDTDIYFDYVVPRLNPGGKIILISTPEGVTDLMGVIEVRSKGKYVIQNCPAIVMGSDGNPVSIWTERFSYEDLMKKKLEIGEEFFEKNYMCNPQAESEHAFFSKKAIISCFDYERTFSTEIEGKSYLGCDFAISKGPNADFDAYATIDKIDGFYIIKKIEIYKGLLSPGKKRRINELNEIYHPIRIRVDKTNLGSVMVTELRSDALPITEQEFHPKERTDLLNTLRNIIDSKKLIIPRSKDDTQAIRLTNMLYDQLMGFKESKNQKTGNTNIISTAIHDDIVMAIAMAVKEAVLQRSARFW